jgi:catechol 2,3-dioxygenase-like lactoylglutathione lyase family enzyme
MKVLFVAGFGPITSDTKESAAFYRDSLGLAFQEDADGYFHTEELKGSRLLPSGRFHKRLSRVLV